MPKLFLSSFFICLQLAAFSQVTNLLHPFVVSNDIDSISVPLKVSTLSIPNVGDILTMTNFACNTECGVLPVQILTFDAERKSDFVVEVTWETAYELNNKEFIVQRSTGNITSFSNVGRLPADSFPALTHHYAFLDGNDYEYTSYYRLLQIDLDKQFTYSRIVAVKGHPRTESISVYPNPATTAAVVEVNLKKTDQVLIDIYNSQGQRIHEQTAYLKKGNNSLGINVKQYGKGIYFIKLVKSDGTILNAKIVKQ